MVFDQGDIVRVIVKSAAERELLQETQSVLVLSPKEFNQLGLTVIAPIFQGGDFSRYAGFAVALPEAELMTQGFVLANMLRSTDIESSHALFVEKVPTSILEDVLARGRAILES